MDWSLTARPGYLRILTEAGDTDPDIPGAQILLLRPPVGNIDTISTNLEFDSTTDFVQGGLLVYQDDRNFLRLTSTVTFGQRIFFVWQHNGQVQSHFVSVEAGVLELRIEKQGNTYIGYYRTDGGLIEVGRFENVNLSNLRVGLGAWNGGGPPRILVDFDGFCLVSSPPTQTQTPTITPTATATSTARIYLPLIRQ